MATDPYGLEVCFRGASKDESQCADADAKKLWDEVYKNANDSIRSTMDQMVKATDRTYGLVFGEVSGDHRFGRTSGPSGSFNAGVITIDTRAINGDLDHADARFVLGRELGHVDVRGQGNEYYPIASYENPIRRAFGFHPRDPFSPGVLPPLNKFGRPFGPNRY